MITARTAKRLAIWTSLAMLAAILAIGSPATAQGATYEVQVGANLFQNPLAGGAPADGARFYSPPLSVHRGDTVQFDIVGFHTATLLPANTDVATWIGANASGLDEPWSLLVPDPDEGDAGLKFNNEVFFSPDTCGGATNPCSYGGSSVVNSGIFNRDDLNGSLAFSTTINANVGDVVTFLCLVHLNMRKSLTVVADADETTTQEDIDAYKDRKESHDARAARKLHNSLPQSVDATGDPRGTVIDAYAGVDGKGFSLLGFYPSEFALRQGQRVRWHFDRLVFEDHTTTFPLKKGLKIANNSGQVPECDLDGDTGTAPDEPGDRDAATIDDVCPGGAGQLEIDIDPRFAPPAGDGVLESRKDFESSGVLGANLPPGEPWVLRFAEASGPKPFSFLCLIHPFMQGRVAVG